MSLAPQPAVEVDCAICHRHDVQPQFPDAAGPAARWPLVCCSHCGLVYQAQARDEDQLDEAQEEAYGEPTKRFMPVVEWGVRLFRSARVRMATKLMPRGGAVLDVGCGRGLFLRMLRERGYDVRGTELSAATAANSYADVPVDVGDLTPGRYADAGFDLISIWHVLEHTRHPDETLRSAFAALKPGGALMLAVPNFASVQAQLSGEQWFHLDLPRHIFQFAPQTLRRLLVDAGFTIERLSTGQWEMDPFGLVQSAMNRVGFRHNRLYDCLRNNPAVHRDLSTASRAGLVALFPVLMALAIPLSAVLRLSGRAGTIICVARKAA